LRLVRTIYLGTRSREPGAFLLATVRRTGDRKALVEMYYEYSVESRESGRQIHVITPFNAVHAWQYVGSPVDPGGVPDAQPVLELLEGGSGRASVQVRSPDIQ